MTKSATASIRPTRQNLYDVYTFVVRNWAVNASDIPGEPALIKAALKPLVRSGLLAAQHINGEKAVTYQSMYDIENQPENEVLDNSDRDFNDAFPVKAEQAPAAKSGATGPRYTDEQLEAGRAARESGLSWPKVAEAAGVKAPSYFSRVLRERFDGLDRPAEKATTKEEVASASAPKTRSTGRRGRKDNGGGSKRAAKPAKKDRTLEITGGAFSGKAILDAAVAAAAADLPKPSRRSQKAVAKKVERHIAEALSTPARKWTAEVACAGQPVLFDYPNNDTLAAVERAAVSAARGAIAREEGSDASVILFKQLAGDAEPKRDRSVYVYREFTKNGEPRIGTQRQGA